MKIIHFNFTLLVFLSLLSCGATKKTLPKDEPTLKSVMENKFLIGTALNEAQITGMDTKSLELVKRHFSSIVAENCMKSGSLHPEENRYDFNLADKFVKFGEDNGMFIIGHCLVWHSQLPRWFCVDKDGKDVSPEVLKQRMREHIHTVVGRYK